MTRLTFILLILLSPVLARAQQATPALHHRSDEDDRTNSAVSTGVSLLPPDAAGEYKLRENDVIEITLDDGHLSGYVSQLGNSSSDEPIPLTFFFSSVSVQARQFVFTTQQLHGESYSFEGTIVRGPGKVRADEGYYLLVGKVIEHGGPHAGSRSISLSSMPTCVEEACE